MKKVILYILRLLGYRLVNVNFEKQSASAQEKEKFKWLKAFQLNTIIDVGANEGQFAEKILGVFPNAVFFCFEPLHSPFLRLQKKFGKNKKFTLYNFALGTEEGEVNMNRNEYSPSSSILEMDELHKSNFDYAVSTVTEKIKVKRLDDALRDQAIGWSLMKIDVQGYELYVLGGAEEVLSKVRVLIVEVSFYELYKGQPLFDDMYSYLKSRGFKYIGSIEQLLAPSDSKILQGDAVFVREG